MNSTPPLPTGHLCDNTIRAVKSLNDHLLIKCFVIQIITIIRFNLLNH